jgi:hypothetical protein
MGSEVASQALIDAISAQGAQVLTIGYLREGTAEIVNAREIAVAPRAIETSRAGLITLWWFAAALWQRLPYSAAKYRSAAYRARVKDLLARGDVDAVVIDHAQMAWILDSVPRHVKIIALAHNVEHEMYRAFASDPTRRLWSRWAYRREARLIEAEERRLAQHANETWTLTEHDARFFASICAGRPVRVVGLPGGASAPSPARPKSCDIALIGNWSWRANRDALEWFLEHVYPRLPRHISIEVAGKDAQELTSRHTRAATQELSTVDLSRTRMLSWRRRASLRSPRRAEAEFKLRPSTRLHLDPAWLQHRSHCEVSTAGPRRSQWRATLTGLPRRCSRRSQLRTIPRKRLKQAAGQPRGREILTRPWPLHCDSMRYMPRASSHRPECCSSAPALLS